MAPPDKDHVRVITEALRKEATVWDDEATNMGKIAPHVEGLRLNRIQAGLFQVIFNTYGEVIDQVIARSNEGKQRMTEVGSTLRSVADTYDRQEAATTHNLRNVY